MDTNSRIISDEEVAKRAEALDQQLEATPEPEVKESEVAPEDPEDKVEPIKEEVKIEPKKEETKTEVKAEPKAEVKVETKDPYKELRREFTKRSQENADLKKELQALKEIVEKATKKPVDLKELAKDPDALLKHYQEQEAQSLKATEEYKNQIRQYETRQESANRANDPEKYPNWKKAERVMGELIALKDPTFLSKFDWANGDIKEVLDQAYEYVQPMIETVDWSKVPGFEPVAEEPKVSPEDFQKQIADAEKRGYEKALKEVEARGKGSTVAGMTNIRSGRRSVTPNFNDMSAAELEEYLKKQQS